MTTAELNTAIKLRYQSIRRACPSLPQVWALHIACLQVSDPTADLMNAMREAGNERAARLVKEANEATADEIDKAIIEMTEGVFTTAVLRLQTLSLRLRGLID